MMIEMETETKPFPRLPGHPRSYVILNQAPDERPLIREKPSNHPQSVPITLKNHRFVRFNRARGDVMGLVSKI